ncbi:MAG: pyrroline-5-carboxylate reductase [Rickettsiales bacterium]|nr:pyrroline-5-carboxylate reductase [Rickettsiales bacterium]
MEHHTLLLIGHGKMGGVLLARWREANLFSHIHVVSPHHTQADSGNLHWHKSLADLPTSIVPSVIVFAVKPALLSTLLPEYAERFTHQPLYLSVAAGKTLGFYQQHLGAHAHIVRAMPNTPALIGEGMTTLCAPDTLAASARSVATSMIEAVGKVLWLEETHMEAATALAGCGPAYVFLFLESLTKAGMNAGLSETDAKTLALQTVKGSEALAAQSPKTFAELCAQVASPGGVTEAALKVLRKDDALIALMQQAIAAALKRNRELAE